MNCTRCKTWTEQPDAHGLCQGCHDYANCRYPVLAPETVSAKVKVYPNKLFRIGSLFSGIGGLELGLERAGLGRTVWQVERDPFCRRVLERHWPTAKRYEDVKIITSNQLERVELLCGGFPCQDISAAHTATKKRGLRGDKSSLWLEYLRLARGLLPKWIVVENVHPCGEWLPFVRRDLHELGYASVPFLVRASDVGAPHERPRIFVVAYAHGESELSGTFDAEVAGIRPYANVVWDRGSAPSGGFRVDDGVSDGVDRLRALGNAVVPQCATLVGRVIMRFAA
jgi:DNA (cytosine-5)-methyltransferase 1